MTLSVDAAMAAFNPELPLAVGLSGGADSTALLVAAAQKWPGQVRAIHVNHGLQAAAAGVAAQCLPGCSALQVPLVVRLEGTNVELGKKIIGESGLNVIPADDLDDAAQKIVAAVQGRG